MKKKITVAEDTIKCHKIAFENPDDCVKYCNKKGNEDYGWYEINLMLEESVISTNELKENDRSQNVRLRFPLDYVESEGYCDSDCEAVKWIGSNCDKRDNCALPLGRCYKKPNEA